MHAFDAPIAAMASAIAERSHTILALEYERIIGAGMLGNDNLLGRRAVALEQARDVVERLEAVLR